MAHEEALMIVNEMQDRMAGLARDIVTALRDGRVSPFEWMSLAGKGTTLAGSLVSLVQDTDAATRADLLYVLEHADVILPEGL